MKEKNTKEQKSGTLQTNEAMLASLDRVMRLLRRRPAKRTNLGRGVYRLLVMIRDREEITTRELAELLEIRPSSLNERLSRLESEQLIMRERDPRDQRVFLVRLLPAGEAHLEEIRQERSAFNEAVGKILTEEEAKVLMGLTDKLAEGIEALGDPGSAAYQSEDRAQKNSGSDPSWT